MPVYFIKLAIEISSKAGIRYCMFHTVLSQSNHLALYKYLNFMALSSIAWRGENRSSGSVRRGKSLFTV